MRFRLLLATLMALGSSVAFAQSADLIPGPTSTPGFDAATHVPAAAFGTFSLLYDNGGLATGVLSGSGVAVPTPGYQWSEVQNDIGNAAESNSIAGFSCSVTTTTIFRCADDVTVPAGDTWTVEAVSAFAYQTGYAGIPSPFTAATLRIWDGPPNDPGSTILFGDATTNVLLTSFEASLYRIFNTTTPPPGSAPGTTRRIWENVMAVSPGLALGEGTYWVDFNFQITGSPANFSPSVTIPGTRGLPGWNGLQYNGTAWAGAIDTGNPGTAPDVAQDFPVRIYGTNLAPTYTVTEPAVGSIVLAGAKATVRWSGPGVPNVGDLVNVYLRKGTGAEIFVGSGANDGKLKVTIPAGTVSGSDYTLVVRRQADATVYGASAAFIVSNAAEPYTFQDPDFLEYWRRGTTRTVLWTRPPSAPAGTVTIELWRLSTLVASVSGQTDDGSFDVALGAGLASVGDYRIEIRNDADPAFFGASPKFNVSRVEVDPPAEGDVWAAGSAQDVTWTTGAYNSGGLVKLSLRSVDGTFSQTVANNRPYPEGTRAVTIPAGAPAGQYQIQWLYTYTPPGGSELRVVVNSNAFTVTNPAAPAPQPQRHFDAPLAGEASPVTYVSVRGLSDGAEVGVFAPMGDGTPVLLASGVVEGGEALVAVPSDIVEPAPAQAGGDEELSFGPEAVLELRTYEGGVESVLDVRSVTTGEGVALASVRFADGAVVTVDVSKDASGSEASGVEMAPPSPNPASGAVALRFVLAESADARLTVHDVLGRTVATVAAGAHTAGTHVASLDASALAPGVYVVRLVAGEASLTERLTVVR